MQELEVSESILTARTRDGGRRGMREACLARWRVVARDGTTAPIVRMTPGAFLEKYKDPGLAPPGIVLTGPDMVSRCDGRPLRRRR